MCILRQISTYVLLGLTLWLASACSSQIETEQVVPEGEYAHFSLSVASLTSTIHTRAVSSPSSEDAINNLYIFIFNPDGEKIFGNFYTAAQLGSSKRLTITSLSGNNKQIYGIANIDLGMMGTTKALLDNIANQSELLAMQSNLLQRTTSRGSSFLMSGSLLNVTIPPGVNTALTLGTIPLKRVDSKVTFNISSAAGVTFTPADWRVVRIPKKVPVIETGDKDLVPDANDYFSSDWAKYEGIGTSNVGRTFSFYVLENLHTPRAMIPTMDGTTPLTANQRYALRQKQEKNPITTPSSKPGQTVDNGDFVYANNNSTYVQLRGNIKYQQGADTWFADVVYTIHLGYVHGENDYDNLRNTHYTYNVTINSANNISVEVKTDSENQPGAEGELTISKKTYSFDAHYDALIANFSIADVEGIVNWYVKTPFESGINDGTLKDYRWLLFRLNKKQAGRYATTTMMNYPGDQYIMKQKRPTLDGYLAHVDSLLNVDQLIILLKESKNRYTANGNNIANTLFDLTHEVYFTAFVQENYYDKNPIDGTTPVDLWKRFVNQPERVMNIILDAGYSADGNSMQSTVLYTFRQSSIQTMYNTTSPTVQTAWGTERLQDDEKYTFWSNTTNGTTLNYNSPSNGRQNTLRMWNIGNTASLRWTSYIDTTRHAMNTTYNYARYTCMQRNRDSDGDGLIDKAEIQWYLASINQLTNLWIGENSFDLEARLYKPSTWTATDQTSQWYVSSTVPTRSNNYDNPTILWSSEGSSVGAMSGAVGGSATAMRQKTFLYRCVRNLGIARTSDSEPEVFATYNASTGVIALDKLDSRSIRGYTQLAELPEHHERQADNLPFWKFEVYKGTHGNNYNWIQMRDAINTGNSPCPYGWRAPNQRELALMLYLIGDDGNWRLANHMSRTRFSFNPVGQYRHGFSVRNDANILYLINNAGETGGLRCVRDLAP